MFRSRIVEWATTLAIMIVLYFGLHAAIEPRIVIGQSMEPTLHTGEYVMLDKVSYHFHQPHRGDIVVFKYPFAPSEDYIKRVIGLPGDHVVVQDDHVYVDGRQLTEPYIAAPPDYSDDKIVPKGYLYVLGDNRDNSSDSHVWGLLPEQDLVGRAMFSFWPLPDLRWFTDPSYPGVR